MSKPEEKLFTQSEVDSIVKERLERERKRYNTDHDTVEELQKQLVSVRAELEDVKASNEQKESQLQSERINNTIIQALEKVNGINPTELSRLFVDKTTIDDKGNVIYTDDSGNSTPIDTYMKEWANKSPWAVRSVQNAGSGAGGGVDLSISTTPPDALRQAFGLKQ